MTLTDISAKESFDFRWVNPQREWGRLIRSACDRRGLSLAELANFLQGSVNEEKIRNWISGRTRLKIEYIAEIARVLGVTQHEQLYALGVVGPDTMVAPMRLEQARDEAARLRRRLIEVSTEGGALGALVHRALESRQFNVEIRPWTEGPAPYRVSPGTLFSLIPIQAELPADAVRSIVGKELQAAGSMPLTDERRSLLPAEWKGNERRSVWMIPELNFAHVPAIDASSLKYVSVAVLSSHISSWGSDIASLTASAIGFGSTNTNLASRILYGEDVALDSRSDFRATCRNNLARELLDEPYRLAIHQVWSHTQSGALGSVVDFLRSASREDAQFIVLLRPTDRLLEYCSHRSSNSSSVEQLRHERYLLEDVVRRSGRSHCVLDVGYPAHLDVNGGVTWALRDAFMERSMMLSADVLSMLDAKDVFKSPHARCVPGFRDYLRACDLRDDGTVIYPQSSSATVFI